MVTYRGWDKEPTVNHNIDVKPRTNVLAGRG